MAWCMGGYKEWTEAEVEAQLSPKKRKSKVMNDSSPDINIHPWDSTVNLSVHQPLYPPGRLVHVVRHYPRPIVVDDRYFLYIVL